MTLTIIIIIKMYVMIKDRLIPSSAYLPIHILARIISTIAHGTVANVSGTVALATVSKIARNQITAINAVQIMVEFNR